MKSGLTQHRPEEKYPEVDSFVMVNVKQVRHPRSTGRTTHPVAEQN